MCIRDRDIRQDQTGLLPAGQGDGLTVGAGDADDPMAEAFHQRLDVHGDESLVLDDEDVGCDLRGQFAAGFLDQITRCV